MEGIVTVLKAWQLHPLADHFAIVLLITAVVADLVAVVASTRLWLRYMATALMVAGALAAGLSYVTGLAEFQRLGEAVTGPAKEILIQHKLYGEYVMYTFGVLALWRLAVQGLGFMARARGTFLIVAVVAIGFLLWEARSGNELLYTYGVGTQVMAAAMGPPPTPAETPAAPLAPAASPTPESAAREIPTAAPTPTTTPLPPTPTSTAQSPTPTPGGMPSSSATRAGL